MEGQQRKDKRRRKSVLTWWKVTEMIGNRSSEQRRWKVVRGKWGKIEIKER